MARFDVYLNPNKVATHVLYVDVQSNLVALSTRWCIPLFRPHPSRRLIGGAQVLVEVNRKNYVLDAPNILAVPTNLLRQRAGRLKSNDQMLAESCMEFMLRGY